MKLVSPFTIPVSFILAALSLSCQNEKKEVSPIGPPILSTSIVKEITTETAECGGIVTSANGGGEITARGVCWSTKQNPTVTLATKTKNGVGTGTFISNISGLKSGTLYYLRGYATNGAGTSYGNQVIFSTNKYLSVEGNGVTDSDGNHYKSIIIGNFEWMKENLKVSKFRNGDIIPTGLSNADWQATYNGACATYNNNPENNSVYGKLYNWYAVSDPRGLCPNGWHVPSKYEVESLRNLIGDDNDGGGKLKSVGTLQNGTGLWEDPNIGAGNIYNFNGLPGGIRDQSGNFRSIGFHGFWWSESQDFFWGSRFCYFYYFDYNSEKYFSPKDLEIETIGRSVRCIKNY